MNPYNVLILLIGWSLVIFCTILIIYDNKKLLSYIKLADERERQLKEVVHDAELMMEELNKFSDYIMNEVEKKKNEYQNIIQYAEAEIGKLNQKTGELLNSLNSIHKNTSFSKEEKSGDNLILEEKSVPLNSKYSEVLRLSGEGMEETEIARRLCMGKGEVQLILKKYGDGAFFINF